MDGFWLLLGLVFVTGCLWSTAALAFGPVGHRLIAAQAQEHLEPAVRDEVQALLGSQSMADIASWADEVRGEEAYRSTAPWHYLNFPPGDCRYDAAALCPEGQCLVGALQAQTAVLADRSQPTPKRAEALKFVVHLYGDLHQPLHLGYRADKGGNDYQLNFPEHQAQARPGDDPQMGALRRWWAGQTLGGYNLHWLWDSLLLDSMQRSDSQQLAALAALQPDAAQLAIVDPPALAEAGCRIAQQPGFYPSGHKLAPQYLRHHWPLLELQLRLGGERLAQWLNHALAPAAH